MSSELPSCGSSVAITVERVPIASLEERLREIIDSGGRLGLLSARRVVERTGFALIAVVLQPDIHKISVWEALLDSSDGSFPSITPKIPQAHWFERAVYDMFGLRPEAHPRFKSVILHEAWPQGFHPLRGDEPRLKEDDPPRDDYRFLKVEGEGVYEIPVGPIHAGIIEPGHFRFSCLGEVIENLEIRLGYQHRGIEHQMTQIPWQRARFLAEAASSDMAAGNAWAHAMAVEQVLGIESPNAAQNLRAVALEIERVASHIGDLGGVCSDIGYAAGAATFGCLRGRALGLGERLTGSRFLTSYIVPGGVARGLSLSERKELEREVRELAAAFEKAEPLLMDNAGALERMEGTGKVRRSLAADFGLVGPAGRASGIEYDVRAAFGPVPYRELEWKVAGGEDGDVLSRVAIRVDEIRCSLGMISALLDKVAGSDDCRTPVPHLLPANATGVGIVEAWRGELIHLICTNANGAIDRYCIKDPSFNNWTGLSIAARGELVADFPLCNKSFGLSYSGNDL